MCNVATLVTNDMKPRRKTKITTLGRVSRTRIQLKQTGGKLKKQSAKVIKTLAKKVA